MKKTLILAGFIGLLALPRIVPYLKPHVPTNEELGEKLSDEIVELVSDLPRTANTGKIVGHRFPFPHELLKKEIVLKGDCKHITIKEWWGTPVTPKSIATINHACNIAHKAFFNFVHSMGYKTYHHEFKINVSMLPWCTITDGEDYRALNDTRWRFDDRPRFCGEDGRICEVWETPIPVLGVSDRDNNWIFMMNDVHLNDPVIPSFSSTFSHELFHMYSYRLGVYDSYPGTQSEKIAKDEQNARAFTKSLGYAL